MCIEKRTSNLNIEIRRVSADLLLPIRHSELWPDQPISFVKIPEDDLGIHYGLYVDGELVSVISAFIEGDSLRFRKFATLATWRGKGLGTRLLQRVIDLAQENKMKRIWCDARADALPFYQRFGFQSFGEPFFKGAIPYSKIEKVFM
ncbi:GNAT family N-acetyltransferase [Dyadobacter tibetensis]|uniref:GNAT family N-acetyltransferase n=1 Tax=Dyadobacter tibetensis TaxID=1211851 RepID=UPI0005C488FD|nr:GNAT family N-acetyltransferase [Dyadobacter tibetensis]